MHNISIYPYIRVLFFYKDEVPYSTIFLIIPNRHAFQSNGKNHLDKKKPGDGLQSILLFRLPGMFLVTSFLRYTPYHVTVN